jgi:beta-lactamase superfamily II metal-dependent hydrolase
MVVRKTLTDFAGRVGIAPLYVYSCLEGSMSLRLRAVCWLVAFWVPVCPAAADDIAPADRVVNHVNVREGPSTDSPVVGILKKGDRASLLLTIPRWYQIRLADGTEGFVSKSWSQRIPAPTAVASGDIGFTIHFLDVDTGDAAIIDIGEHEIIIDGGNSTKVLLDYIQDRQIVDGPIELVVVTHVIGRASTG